MKPSRRDLGRLGVWAGLFVVAGVLGRLSAVDDQVLGLVWPAAGVAVLWWGSSDRRRLPADVGVFALAVYAVNVATGAPLGLAALLVVTNVLQTGAFVLLVRWGAPHLHPAHGATAPVTLRDLAVVVGAAALSCGAAAVLGTLGLRLIGEVGALSDLLVWWGRNTWGVLAVGVVGMLVLAALAQWRDDLAAGTRRAPPSPRTLTEAAALALGSGLLLGVVFGASEALPISFLLLATTVVVAIRLGPLAVALHSLAVGAGAVVLTLAGRGPFAQVADISERALVAQVFVTLTFVTGLVLACYRTERDRALARLGVLRQETQARASMLAAVLEHMQDGLAVVDAHGTFLVRNTAGHALTGQRLDPFLDFTLPGSRYGLWHLDGSEITPEELPPVRAIAGEVVREDYQLVRPRGGETVVLEITAAPLPVGDGTNHAIVSFRDVTAIRHDRDALAAFAGVVAHDLKRPLSVINGWSESLADQFAAGAVSAEDGTRILARVSAAAQQMGVLIDDLLHLTVVRDAPVSAVVVDLSQAAAEAAAVFQDREPFPSVEVQPGLVATADPVMVRQLLDNLIGNAVKYVAPGVRPHVRVEGRQEGPWSVLSVIDNGIGVPAEHRERIFETFHRVHADTYRGTGLGLAIVRRAAERCGGQVVVRDDPGGGSAFEVRLPGAGRPEPDDRMGEPARVVLASPGE